MAEGWPDAHFPKFVLHLSAHLSRTSESYGHQQIHDSSAAFLFEVPEQSSSLVVQELQIGGTSATVRHLRRQGNKKAAPERRLGSKRRRPTLLRWLPSPRPGRNPCPWPRRRGRRTRSRPWRRCRRSGSRP